jgi:hypothetical protein
MRRETQHVSMKFEMWVFLHGVMKFANCCSVDSKPTEMGAVVDHHNKCLIQ